MARCPRCSAEVQDNLAFCPRCGEELGKRKPVTHVGTIIQGNFAVKELLGEGGMGKVYLAEQLSLKKPVAIKILKKEFANGEVYSRRFEREALAASRLHHPNSIQIIEFGRAETGELFLVMEYLRGVDLAVLMMKDFPFEPDRIVNILGQVASALVEAHAQGVIHRDLKPENIMVEKTRDGRDFVKVLDFGLAQIIAPGAPKQSERLTDMGMICGTPEYMSPEQARGEKLDPRSDIYSLGVIMYQMLTGKLPFEAPNPIDVVTRHLQEKPVPPRRLRPDLKIPRKLEAICLKCMQKRRADRYQNVSSLYEDLEDFAAALKLPKIQETPGRVTGSKDSPELPPLGKDDDVSGEMLKLRKELFDMPSGTEDHVESGKGHAGGTMPPAAAELDLGGAPEPLDLAIERTAPPLAPAATPSPGPAERAGVPALRDRAPGRDDTPPLVTEEPPLRLAREPGLTPRPGGGAERKRMPTRPVPAKRGGKAFLVVTVLLVGSLAFAGYHFYPRLTELLATAAGPARPGKVETRKVEPGREKGPGGFRADTRRIRAREKTKALPGDAEPEMKKADLAAGLDKGGRIRFQERRAGETGAGETGAEAGAGGSRANEAVSSKTAQEGGEDGDQGGLAALMGNGRAASERTKVVSYNRPLKDKNAEKLYKIARGYIKAGKYDDAINALKKVIWVERYYAPARRDLAFAYFKRGLKESAAREFRNYLRIEPQAKDAREVKRLLGLCTAVGSESEQE